MLIDILISKVRVKILELFLGLPGQSYHVREIVRRVEEEINAVRRELARLEKTGFLQSEWRANRRYYSVKRDFVYLAEFLSMVNKSVGAGGSEHGPPLHYHVLRVLAVERGGQALHEALPAVGDADAFVAELLGRPDAAFYRRVKPRAVPAAG